MYLYNDLEQSDSRLQPFILDDEPIRAADDSLAVRGLPFACDEH